MPKAEAVADSGGDSDHVLERSSEFHADNVVVCIKTEARVTQCLLYGLRTLGVARCNGDRSGIATSDFFGEGGTAQGADTWTELRENDLRDDFRHSQVRL